MRVKILFTFLLLIGILVGVFWFTSQTKKSSYHITVEAFKSLSYQEQQKAIEAYSVEDPAAAWGLLKDAYYVNGTVTGNVHEFAHIVGNELYRNVGFDGVEVCDAAFAYGCFHGVTEVMLAEQGPQSIPEIQSTCLEKFPPSETMDYTGCIHGAGHGLFSWTLFELEEALALCEEFDFLYQDYCFDGVYMERSFVDPTLDISASDPWRQCLEIDERYRHACSRYQQQAFRTALGWDDAEVAAACEAAPSERIEETCTLSVGFRFAQKFSSDIDRAIKTCVDAFATEKAEATCLRGVATEITFQRYPDWKEVSNSVCENIESAELRQDCIEMRDGTAERYRLE